MVWVLNIQNDCHFTFLFLSFLSFFTKKIAKMWYYSHFRNKNAPGYRFSLLFFPQGKLGCPMPYSVAVLAEAQSDKSHV